MLEVLTLFILASILGLFVIFLLRAVCTFNKNQPFVLGPASFWGQQQQGFFDPQIILLLLPSAIQAILLSHLRANEEFSNDNSAYFSISLFLFLNMAVYMLVIEPKKNGEK